MRRSCTVTWHFRMNREGRTCIARETKAEGGGIWGVIELLRMREHLDLESVSHATLVSDFPIDLLAVREELGEVGTVALKDAAQQYFIHAAVARASREAVALLVQICEPKKALRARIEANFIQ